MIFRTRFAPSPTGPLHLGHAYSAILAHDTARRRGGEFLLRMEDTEFDRVSPEWDVLIREDLSWLGLTWDGPVHRQSEHIDSYAECIKPLIEMGLLYPCSCSRSEIRAASAAPQEGVAHAIYPGTCRGRPMSEREPRDALRLNLAKAYKALQGTQVQFVETGPANAGIHDVTPEVAFRTIGDIVLVRKSDGVVAYFLASALDDSKQGITHVFRGEDIFEFTPVQVLLQLLLGLETPEYHHHKLIRDEAGKRLAKRDDARAIQLFRNEGYSPEDVRRMVGL